MSFKLSNADHRYANDPTYRTIVDLLKSMILKLELAPSEVREAAMLACVQVEMSRPISPIVLRESEDPDAFVRAIEFARGQVMREFVVDDIHDKSPTRSDP